MIGDLRAAFITITTTMDSAAIENAYAPPDDRGQRGGRDGRRERRFNTVRMTAWTYTVYWAIFVPVAALDARRALPAAGLAAYAIVSVACALLAWSATHKRRLGYYFCSVFSAFILVLPPFGTVLGWNMLRALRLNRDQFFGP